MTTTTPTVLPPPPLRHHSNRSSSRSSSSTRSDRATIGTHGRATGTHGRPPAPAAEPAAPTVEPAAPEVEPAAPTVIKIDDFAGSSPPQPSPVGAPAPPPVAQPDGERQVISIDADDLPDAVYVEGSLEGGGASSIVFIEDDVAADALTPESDRDLRRGIEPTDARAADGCQARPGSQAPEWLVAAFVLVLVGVAALATFGS